ncbi:unnamed protein product [Urochloa humidicola]
MATNNGASSNTDPSPPDSSSSSSKTGFLKTCFKPSTESMLSQGSGCCPYPTRCPRAGGRAWPSSSPSRPSAATRASSYSAAWTRARSCMSTYPDIGALAFGRRGRLVVAAFMYLELYLVAVDFLILEGDNLHKLFPVGGFRVGSLHVGAKQGFVLAATLAVLPTTWFSSLGVLAYAAAGGALASVVLVAAVVWVGVFDGVGFHQRGRLVHWAGMPSAISLYSFCFSGHAVFPMIYNGMKDRKKFPMVLFICFVVSTLSYGFMGVIGYLMYGDTLMSQVTLNLPTGKASSKVAIYTTLVNPLTKYALVIAPIAEAVEAALGVGKSRVLRVLVRTALVVGTAVVALAVPFFADVVALTGALLSCTATMLLPCLCYLRVRAKVGYRKRWVETVACVVIVVVGAAIVVLGTYSSVKQIVQRLK